MRSTFFDALRDVSDADGFVCAVADLEEFDLNEIDPGDMALHLNAIIERARPLQKKIGHAAMTAEARADALITEIVGACGVSFNELPAHRRRAVSRLAVAIATGGKLK